MMDYVRRYLYSKGITIAEYKVKGVILHPNLQKDNKASLK